MLEIVQTDTDVEGAPRFRNPWASSTLRTAGDDAAEIAQNQHSGPSLPDCLGDAEVAVDLRERWIDCIAPPRIHGFATHLGKHS